MRQVKAESRSERVRLLVVLFGPASEPSPQFLFHEATPYRHLENEDVSFEATSTRAVVEAILGVGSGNERDLLEAWSGRLATLLDEAPGTALAVTGATTVALIEPDMPTNSAVVLARDDGYAWVETGESARVAFVRDVDDLVTLLDEFVARGGHGA